MGFMIWILVERERESGGRAQTKQHFRKGSSCFNSLFRSVRTWFLVFLVASCSLWQSHCNNHMRVILHPKALPSATAQQTTALYTTVDGMMKGFVKRSSICVGARV